MDGAVKHGISTYRGQYFIDYGVRIIIKTTIVVHFTHDINR